MILIFNRTGGDLTVKIFFNTTRIKSSLSFFILSMLLLPSIARYLHPKLRKAFQWNRN